MSGYLGIDPGVRPAAALWLEEGPPLFWSGNDLSMDGEPDVFKLRDLLRKVEPTAVVLEHVWVRPTDGKASGARLVRAAALIEATVRLCGGNRLTLVRPTVWKRDFKLLRKDKEASRRQALRMAPLAYEMLKRKKDHDRAEALLLAIWGHTVLGGRP